MSSGDDVIERAEDILEHAGVKGMKWGVRKERTPGVSRSTDRMARKDAEEHARAKMFYGDGAGTRRKLIRETVNSRSKADPTYKKAFDQHLSKQDLGAHGSKAVKERTRKDRTDRTKKQAGFIARRFTGEMGTQAAFTAATLAGAAFLASPKARGVMVHNFNKVKNTVNHKRGAAHISKFLRDNM